MQLGNREAAQQEAEAGRTSSSQRSTAPVAAGFTRSTKGMRSPSTLIRPLISPSCHDSGHGSSRVGVEWPVLCRCMCSCEALLHSTTVAAHLLKDQLFDRFKALLHKGLHLQWVLGLTLQLV
jgi:hypothetical protein